MATFGFQNLLERHFMCLNVYLNVIKVKGKVHPRTGQEDSEEE
jgi:hypothetical protein